MTRKTISLDGKIIEKKVQTHFNRICPKAGKEEQWLEQEKILSEIKSSYEKSLCPQLTYTVFENGCLEQDILTFGGKRICCQGLFSEKKVVDLCAVIVYGICIPEIKIQDKTDLLKSFYLDCFMTALLDGTRDWLQEYLKENLESSDSDVSAPFGPGFFGMGMELIPELLEMIDGDSIGMRQFYQALYPPKSNLGFYLIYKKGAVNCGTDDCSSCLGDSRNCIFCKNFKQKIE